MAFQLSTAAWGLQSLTVGRVLLSAVLVSLPVLAQKTGGAPSAPASPGTSIPGGTLGTGTGTRNGTYGSYPNNYPNPGQRRMDQPIFLSGRVQLDDGSPLSTQVRIQRVCGASTHTETHTDSRGQFSFQVGQSMVVDTDASNASVGSMGRGGMSSLDDSPFGGASRMGGGDTTRQLWNCELRADYPGYRSDTVRLAGRMPMDNPDVGTIVLHRIGKVEGSTISVTTALAPKNAQKAYTKGLQLVEKGKLEEAQTQFQEATNIYPKYAIAWYALGQAQEKAGQSGAAQKSYESAAAADTHYVSPYDQMAKLAAKAGDWEHAAEYSRKAISMNPVEFPSSFWYNAVASYQLKKTADAESSVRDLLKLDTRHDYPQAENLMGQLLLDQGKYPDAATHLRNYLSLAPKADNANAIRDLLTKIDGRNTVTQTDVPKP